MITKELTDFLGYNFTDVENYINNYSPVEELKFLNSYKDRRLFIELTNKDLENIDEGYRILKNKNIDVSYDDYRENKITIEGQKRKLFKYLLANKLCSQRIAEDIGAYKLPNKKLYLVISTNFDDFLMASTKNQWTSCINLNGGEYNFTVAGNIFLDGRFIIYITNLEKKEYKGLESYNMICRSFGFIDTEGNLRSILYYPYKTQFDLTLNDMTIKAPAGDVESKYSLKLKIPTKSDVYLSPYLDACKLKDGKLYFCNFASVLEAFLPTVYYSANDFVSYDSYMLGLPEIEFLPDDAEAPYEEYIKKHCDICESTKGKIVTYRGKNYCPSCFASHKEVCDICYKEAPCIHTEDNQWLCEECARDLPRCEKCGDVKRTNSYKNCRFCRSKERKDIYRNPSFEYIKYISPNKINFYNLETHMYYDKFTENKLGLEEDDEGLLFDYGKYKA